jgi:tellurite resistance protein TehA-like permease
MRTAIGLIGLGLVGGVVPTGLPGFAHAAQVLAGTAGALLSLVVCCLAGAVAARRAASSSVRAPRRQRSPITSRQSVPRSI